MNRRPPSRRCSTSCARSPTACARRTRRRARPVEEALQDIDRRLWRAFRWLDEALGHLEVIRPDVAHAFRLDNDADDRDAALRPRLRVVPPARARRARACSSTSRCSTGWRRTATDRAARCQPGAALGVEERLRAAHAASITTRPSMDEQRVVRHGRVPGARRRSPRRSGSRPTTARQVVEVTLRNVDRFESVALEFRADAIDEAALEDLVRFILGEANAFLRRAPLAGVGARRSEARSAPASTIPPIGAGAPRGPIAAARGHSARLRRSPPSTRPCSSRPMPTTSSTAISASSGCARAARRRAP